MFRRFVQWLIHGPKTWQSMSEEERQAAMSRKGGKRLSRFTKPSRVDIGPMLPGEGSYTNTEKREQFVGSNDSAMARQLAEERAAIIEEAGRTRD